MTEVDPTEPRSARARYTSPGPRIAAIRAALQATRYSICLERPRLLARFTWSRSGLRALRQPPMVRRARALAFVMARRRPRIYEHELIVGNMTSKRVAANYYPEGGSLNIVEDIWRLDRRQVPLHLSRSETAQLVAIALGSFATSVGGRALLRSGRLGDFFDFFRARRYFITEAAGISHQVVDYGKVVSSGLGVIDAEAAERLSTRRRADGTRLDGDAVAFYTAVRVIIAAITEMAANLAAAADLEAERSSVTPARAVELREIASACRRVPYLPARSFHEGVQACWLVHVALNLEDFEQGLSFGRLDQILYPLYRADLASGRLTRHRATEILASLCLKSCETLPLYSERIDEYFSGNGVAQGITLGGTDDQGVDCTNELSGAFLDAYAQVRTREPALHVRVHSDTPRWFLEQCAALLQLGCGKPAFFGDAAVVAALENAGMTSAHARDYAVIGCVEMASQGRTYNSSDAALFNLPLCLELALGEGRQLGEGQDARIGAATAPVTAMDTIADVVAAYRAQVSDGIDNVARVLSALEQSYRVWRTTPVNSMLTDGCMRRGCDVTWGGATYDMTSIQAVGVADVGDSLFAIETLVFDQRRYSLVELVAILRADFAGHEPLRAELVNRMARYGNGDKRVDHYLQIAADGFADAVRGHGNTRGGRYVPGFYSMTCHHGFGRRTGALPDGRRAGERFSNGIAPVDGVERSGPSAVLRSASGLDSRAWANCYALNLKFDHKAVAGTAGRRALASLVKNYFDQGGMQVQINVLDAETLRAAQHSPADYPGIVVRVAGYCAYFHDLQPEVQDEIIERTAHGLGPG